MATSIEFIIENHNIEEYPISEMLINVCKSFEDHEIELTANFMGRHIPIYNCNAVGNILENVFYPTLKDTLDLEEGYQLLMFLQ